MSRRWPLLLGLIAGLGAIALGLWTGADHADQWSRAARWTARIGLPIFLVAFTASSLAKLWPNAITRSLWQGRRWWGLGFAACHTLHLYALVRFLEISGEERPLPALAAGGIAYVLMFAMAATSNDTAMKVLGRNWKRLHTVGGYYLWLIFTLSYGLRLAEPGKLPEAIYGVTLCLGALALRFAAKRKARRG